MPGPFLIPVRGNPGISCGFDCHRSRRPPSSNPGTDWPVGIGTPVYAPMDATVIRVSHIANQPQGRHVWLRDPRDGAELQMMHFLSPEVGAGQQVKAGQHIGLSGNSGNSTGPHLHTSLWYQGRTLDFMDYVGGLSGGGSNTFPNPTRPEEDDMDIQLCLYKPTNNLLLVDHVNRTIRELGSKNSWLRDYYATKYVASITVVSDSGNGEGLPSWQSMTAGYAYITTPNIDTPVNAALVKPIADAVVAAIGKPSVQIDYAAIATAVNNDAAKRLAG